MQSTGEFGFKCINKQANNNCTNIRAMAGELFPPCSSACHSWLLGSISSVAPALSSPTALQDAEEILSGESGLVYIG